MSSFSEQRHPVARKQHGCAWCHEWIEVGERHFHFVGKWEGEFQDWRMHEECADAHQRETYEGEICEADHQMGRTCDEKEAADNKIAKEINEAIVDSLKEKGVPEEFRKIVTSEDIGEFLLREVFYEAVYQEERRVAELRTKAKAAAKVKAELPTA